MRQQPSDPLEVCNFALFALGFFCTDIVQMHIETLDAVHRESKRLPPIQKVTNSIFYIGLDATDMLVSQAGPPPATPTPTYSNPTTTESESHSRYVCDGTVSGACWVSTTFHPSLTLTHCWNEHNNKSNPIFCNSVIKKKQQHTNPCV